jgi:hypothetical protein
MTVAEYLQLHMSKEKAEQILSYLKTNNCSLKITRARKTKRGDFRFGRGNLSISVNQDPNSFRFLFTLLHEMAHLKNYLDFGTKVQPHGQEWKANFRQIFNWFKMHDDFSKDSEVYAAVLDELQNPKACSGVNHTMERAFIPYDAHQKALLIDVPIGSHFIFGANTYQKLENRRTRVMCLNVSNKRKYTINKGAQVELI